MLPTVKKIVYKIHTGNQYHAYLSNWKVLDCYKDIEYWRLLNSLGGNKWKQLEDVAEINAMTTVCARDTICRKEQSQALGWFFD